MNRNLREQIYKKLDLRDTNDLLDIWLTNNRAEWSDVAFEAIKDILKRRIGDVPPQNEPVLENMDVSQDDGLEDWEVKLLDDDNQPELYNTLEVLSLKDKINKAAVAVIVVNILLGLLSLEFVRVLFLGDVLSFPEILQTLPNMLFTILSVGLQIVVLYFPLKALLYILRILMEMELNSRKAK